MDDSSRLSVDRRLARIEGQIRGIRRMVQEGEYCCDILTQLAATRSALDQAGVEMAASHVKSCILGQGTDEAHDRTNSMSRDDLIDELRTTLSRMVR